MQIDEKMRPEIGQPESMQTTVVYCGEMLGISTVHVLQDSLKQSLASGLPIEIDASGIESADAAAIQLLCAFARDAASSGYPIRWDRPTQVLINTAKFLQVQNLLALPDDDPTTKD
jgi:ABC-type transporter Mla MlaB component